MKRLEHIEKEIAELSQEELGRFHAWFDTFNQACWDRDLEQDVGSGALDALVDSAISDHRTSSSR